MLPARITGITLSVSLLLLISHKTVAQEKDTATRKVVIAGAQYDKSSFHNWLWGKHYRKDWTTPVSVPILLLDTVNGGLMGYGKGGGRQSKTLQMRNPQGREYVLRSIDKSFGKALPDKYRGTFIEKIIDDQVSIAEPYAALTVPPLATAAGIYHTEPVIVFIPDQKGLGEFREDYKDDLYLLEQRPDENWEDAPNFGNSKNIVGTKKLLEHIFEDNDRRVDQREFVKARIFDMFIGDWGRHEDQWRWASFEDGDKVLYKPIPRDRDQVYTKFDGVLLSLVMSVADVGHLESFGGDIKNVSTYNYPARNIDRKLANEPDREEWIQMAKDMKAAMTNEVIENAIKKLPTEVYAISGKEIEKKLKSRRDKLEKLATDYYDFLARNVDVSGTRKSEYFAITYLPEGKTSLQVFDLNKENKPKKEAFYSRVFRSEETKEIRVYGLSGNDVYVVKGDPQNHSRIRIIGGPAKDTYIDSAGTKGLLIYDNKDNAFTTAGGTKKKLSSNPFVHLYVYDAYRYDKKGLGPIVFYSTEDRIHVGLKYTIEKQAWRKYPYGQAHEIAARYSINERAPSFAYTGHFPQLIGNWDMRILAEYDFIRWNNFFGIGNETLELTPERDYHRVRSRELFTGIGLERSFSGRHLLNATVFYQTIKILNDPGRFLTERLTKFSDFSTTQFGGARLSYEYQKVDDPSVPRRGILMEATGTFTQNLEVKDSNVAQVSGFINFFIPLSKSFVFSLKTGGATLRGKPEFYQLNKLSGSKTLRGYRKFRFYGESMAYAQSEIQWIRPVKSRLFNGQAGIIGLFDAGRVWQPGEDSNTWHTGYGGGLMMAPFGKISIAVFFARSSDGNDLSVRFRRGL